MIFSKSAATLPLLLPFPAIVSGGCLSKRPVYFSAPGGNATRLDMDTDIEAIRLDVSWNGRKEGSQREQSSGAGTTFYGYGVRDSPISTRLNEGVFRRGGRVYTSRFYWTPA